MEKQKYADNIITTPREQERNSPQEWNDIRKSHVYVDGDIVRGGWYFQGSWLYKASDEPYPEKTHSHDAAEYLGFIGTNPDDPTDLGGEIELYLDGEKYTLTKTSVVFIPGGVEHCPVYARRVDSPIWFFATFCENAYTKQLPGEEQKPV